MSLYSLDSLEAVECHSENGRSFESSRGENLNAVTFSSTKREIPGGGAETRQVIERRHAGETRNPLIANETAKAGPEALGGFRSPGESLSSEGYPGASRPPISTDVVSPPVSIPKRKSHRANSGLERKESSSRTAANGSSSFKNDKKLIDVLAPRIVEGKTKQKTYLERYRERLGVTTEKSIHSPEGSTLSIFGDTSYDPITDVDSRPPTTTPRDDQSELSFYRRLINQPRTTRSCDVGPGCIVNSDFRSVSDCGLTMNGGKQRLSYRPYDIRDYECLTVPPADRSLGPDTVEIQAKWAKLMRRTRYGDLASCRNRQNVVRSLQIRKCKRTTSVQKSTVEFSLTEDGVAGQPAESKNFGDTVRNRSNSLAMYPAINKTQRTLRSKQMLTFTSAKHPKSYTGSKSTGPTSTKSLILPLEKDIGDSSLEDLQRRHQNEKRVMDLLINRTLLR